MAHGSWQASDAGETRLRSQEGAGQISTGQAVCRAVEAGTRKQGCISVG